MILSLTYDFSEKKRKKNRTYYIYILCIHLESIHVKVIIMIDKKK